MRGRTTTDRSRLRSLRAVRVHLLVVEDDAKIGKTVAQALEGNGYHVNWVTTGAAALDSVASDPPALVLANAGRALTREHIMEEVWDEHWFGSTKTLDMHISAVRRKLGECDSDV